MKTRLLMNEADPLGGDLGGGASPQAPQSDPTPTPQADPAAPASSAPATPAASTQAPSTPLSPDAIAEAFVRAQQRLAPQQQAAAPAQPQLTAEQVRQQLGWPTIDDAYITNMFGEEFSPQARQSFSQLVNSLQQSQIQIAQLLSQQFSQQLSGAVSPLQSQFQQTQEQQAIAGFYTAVPAAKGQEKFVDFLLNTYRNAGHRFPNAQALYTQLKTDLEPLVKQFNPQFTLAPAAPAAPQQNPSQRLAGAAGGAPVNGQANPSSSNRLSGADLAKLI